MKTTIIFRTSRRFWLDRLPALMLFLSLTVALFGCGDNDESDDRVFLNGMAAGGAPIIGTVNVRGADGNVSSDAIRSDGSFSVDVSALTAPFLVWAEGDVHGKSVTLYSTCDSVSSNVNVTPATDTAMAMALGNTPADYFQDNPDAGVPDQADLAAAVQTIVDLLAEVFVTLGLPADFNIMTSQFNADGQGFDLLLDMVSMDNDSETAQIIDDGSGEVLFEYDLEAGEQRSNAGPEEANDIISANLDQEGQIAMILRIVQELYAERKPSAEELAAALDNYVSTDFMSNGLSAAGLYDQWALEQDKGPKIGMTFSDIWIDPMSTYTNGIITIDEYGNNHAGAWVFFNATSAGGEVSRVHFAFVQEEADGFWKWAGDRCPFLEGGDVNAVAMKRTNISDDPILRSGLEFAVNDVGNLALNRGVDYVMVFNPTLPTYTSGGQTYHAIVMERSGAEITEWAFTSLDTEFGNIYTQSDGLNISSVQNNLEFVFIAMNADDQPLYIWIDTLTAPPLSESRLSENQGTYFSIITTIGGQSAGSSIPTGAFTDNVTVSWSHPDDTDLFPESSCLYLKSATDERVETLDNPADIDSTLDAMDWTSATFTYPSSISGSPTEGYVSVEYMDSLGRQFEHTFFFVVE